MTTKEKLIFHLEVLFWIIIILSIFIPGAYDAWLR